MQMVNFKLGNEMWKVNIFIDLHGKSIGQRKNQSPQQESNPWPPECRTGALSTELGEHMDSKVI